MGTFPLDQPQSGLFDGLVFEFDYTRHHPAAAVGNAYQALAHFADRGGCGTYTGIRVRGLDMGRHSYLLQQGRDNVTFQTQMPCAGSRQVRSAKTDLISATGSGHFNREGPFQQGVAITYFSA
jgi:hypothetical protein